MTAMKMTHIFYALEKELDIDGFHMGSL